MNISYNKLYDSEDDFIAYINHSYPKNNLGIIWFSGLNSDMNGTKVSKLSSYAQQNNINFCKFDYFGHGKSSGDIEDGIISKWLENGLSVIDNICNGHLILVGSSMGAWLALLCSLQRKKRIKGIILLAPAVDMTERLMWDEFTSIEKIELESHGSVKRYSKKYDSNYIITEKLIIDGRNHLLLNDRIKVDFPVRIIHGMLDEAVPWELSLDIGRRIKSQNIKTLLIKDADHSLSRQSDMRLLFSNIEELINK